MLQTARFTSSSFSINVSVEKKILKKLVLPVGVLSDFLPFRSEANVKF